MQNNPNRLSIFDNIQIVQACKRKRILGCKKKFCQSLRACLLCCDMYHNRCYIDTVFPCFSLMFPLVPDPIAANQLRLSQRAKHNNRSRTPLCELFPSSQNVQYWETAHMQRSRPLIGCGRSLAQARPNEGPPLFVSRLVRSYKTAAAMRGRGAKTLKTHQRR